MALHRSLDEYKVIATLIHDVYRRHGLTSSTTLKHTVNRVLSRCASEGIGFLSKTLPKLGKMLDRALAGDNTFDCAILRLKRLPGSQKLPKLFGELFTRVLASDGSLLPNADATCVASLRLLCFMFYKYKLPYTSDQELAVVQKFVRTEDDLCTSSRKAEFIKAYIEALPRYHVKSDSRLDDIRIARRARRLLTRLFMRFDPTDIQPRHGPGVVATKQQLWEKYLWRNVSSRITDVYPFDAYFMASGGHVCDNWRQISDVKEETLPARVLLVPKDSRGPRLISCEPVDFQWIQQGLGRAIVQHVESTPLTKWNVFFTNQQPNQFGALWGSKTGRYATLDLNEASDRVSVSLVRLLFPDHISGYLEACRTSETMLPDGRRLELKKFAPMGSALCFPVLALTVWALLTAGARDRDTRESILVYGDDVIVPTAYAEDAMSILESFGLKVNRDKSCIKGSFRESCGMDAFNGVCVTPVRIRTVWSPSKSPERFTSWVAYANSFWKLRMWETYDLIASELCRIYGPIPTTDQVFNLAPSLPALPENARPIRRRVNKSLQRLQFYALTVKAPSLTHHLDGWTKLLRYFAEGASLDNTWSEDTVSGTPNTGEPPSSVSSYTQRRTSMLVRRWR